MSGPIAERWFLGTRFSCIDQPSLIATMRARDPRAPFATVSTPNAAHVVRIQQGHAGNIAANRACWMVVCDSRVLIRLAALFFRIDLPLVTGSDLTRVMFEQVLDPNEPITILGSDEKLAGDLRAKYGLTALSFFSPPYGFYRRADQMDEAAAYVEAHPARYVFLACGAPQSEQLGLHIEQRGKATGIGLCIGASLQFLTGEVKRAPVWVQKAGLEWLFRLLQEPRRLGRRFVAEQLPILWITLRYKLNPGLRHESTLV